MRVYGFTDKMPELLAAADVLVHSTGGVTCLEAQGRGHAGRLLRAAGRTRAPEHARDGRARPAAAGQRHRRAARARAGQLRRGARGRRRRVLWRPAPLVAGRASEPPAAVDVVLHAPRRVRPIPRWRLRAGGVRDPARAAGAGAADVDDVHRRGRRAGGQAPARAPAEARQDDPARRRPDRARARRRHCAAVAAALAAKGIHVSFADDGSVPSRARIAALRALGDELVPEVPGSAPCAGCARAACCTRRRARWGCATHFYYLQPRGGLTRRPAGARAHRRRARRWCGALRLSATGPLPQRPHARRRRAGGRSSDGSLASVSGLERIVSWLGRERARRRAAGVADALSLPSAPAAAASARASRRPRSAARARRQRNARRAASR